MVRPLRGARRTWPVVGEKTDVVEEHEHQRA